MRHSKATSRGVDAGFVSGNLFLSITAVSFQVFPTFVREQQNRDMPDCFTTCISPITRGTTHSTVSMSVPNGVKPRLEAAEEPHGR